MTDWGGETNILDELKKWLKAEKERYDEELFRISKVAPHLYGKLMCLATDSSMCGQVLDKIEDLQFNDLVRE